MDISMVRLDELVDPRKQCLAKRFLHRCHPDSDLGTLPGEANVWIFIHLYGLPCSVPRRRFTISIGQHVTCRCNFLPILGRSRPPGHLWPAAEATGLGAGRPCWVGRLLSLSLQSINRALPTETSMTAHTCLTSRR